MCPRCKPVDGQRAGLTSKRLTLNPSFTSKVHERRVHANIEIERSQLPMSQSLLVPVPDFRQPLKRILGLRQSSGCKYWALR